MRLLRKARLAKLLGTTKQALGQRCRRDPLRSAVMPNGAVNIDAPEMVVYLQQLGLTPDDLVQIDAGVPVKNAGRPPRAEMPVAMVMVADASKPTAPTPFEDLPAAEELGPLTFNEIIARFGSRQGARDWVDIKHRLAATRKLELANAETDGKLIPREAVRVHVFGLIDGAFRRLLQDAPRTIARRVYAMAKAGEPVEKAEELVRDTASSVLRHVRDGATRVLREGARSGQEAA
jgi:hypothetical protein